jgi:hypothetical protein
VGLNRPLLRTSRRLHTRPPCVRRLCAPRRPPCFTPPPQHTTHHQNPVLYARLLSVPLVMSYHTHIPEYIPRYTWRGLVAPMWSIIRWCTRRADLTLVTSKAMKVLLCVGWRCVVLLCTLVWPQRCVVSCPRTSCCCHAHWLLLQDELTKNKCRSKSIDVWQRGVDTGVCVCVCVCVCACACARARACACACARACARACAHVCVCRVLLGWAQWLRRCATHPARTHPCAPVPAAPPTRCVQPAPQVRRHACAPV